MAISPNDIVYLLSGGTYNNNPYNSLGGEPSLRAVFGVVNNLFDDVTSSEAEQGSVDYRCIYVANNNAVDSFYDTRLYIESQTIEGSNIKIGVPTATDTQRIIVAGSVQGGSFTISYDGTSVTVNWDLYLAQWAKNIEDGLNALSELGGVVVDASTYSTEGGDVFNQTRVFEITFAGVSNNRYHPTLQLVANNLIAPSPATIQITKIQDGCPINAIAAEIDTDKIEPYGITWETPTEAAPLFIGTMRHGDSFPIWIQRTTSAQSDPLSDDGFVLRVLGRPFSL